MKFNKKTKHEVVRTFEIETLKIEKTNIKICNGPIIVVKHVLITVVSLINVLRMKKLIPLFR